MIPTVQLIFQENCKGDDSTEKRSFIQRLKIRKGDGSIKSIAI